MPGKTKIFIIGAGDKGTAAAIRIFKSGFRPILAERNNPTDLHFFRNLSDVVYLGEKTIEDVRCRLYNPIDDDQSFADQLNTGRQDRIIPMIKIESYSDLAFYKPDILVDCRGTIEKDDAQDWSGYSCVIRIGSTFKVGRDGHFVIGSADDELGRVYRLPTDLKADLPENKYLSNAPLEGVFVSHKTIGDRVSEREKICTLNEISILAPRNGIITGLLHSGHFIRRRQPIFEIKPESVKAKVSKQIPVSSVAIAGGILEAILTFIFENRSN
jgi:hypothetical protein